MLIYRPAGSARPFGHRGADPGRRRGSLQPGAAGRGARRAARGGRRRGRARHARRPATASCRPTSTRSPPGSARGRRDDAEHSRMSESIPAATRMGAVHLTVSSLARSLEYYRESIGLEVLARRAPVARRSAPASTRLLELVEVPGAQPAPGRTGLFHFALLLPDRRSLALWLAHAVRTRVRLAGASDHFVSEAIYLSDPDRHGIEIYADRPRELWEGQVAARMGTDPLDLDGLLGELDDPETAAVRPPARRHVDGARPPAGLADPAERRVLPRPARLRPDGRVRRPGRVPLGRRLSPPRRRQHLAQRRRGPAAAAARPRCGASRSCCRTPPRAISWPSASRRAASGGRGARRTGRSHATRRATRSRSWRSRLNGAGPI